MARLIVTNIQRFCTHDGPGIRTTVFLKGCPLRCTWCHNPETQSARPEIFYFKQRCIGCGACEAVCTEGAHRFTEAEGHVFLAARCHGCGACAAACPAGALEAVGREMEAEAVLAEAEKDRAFYGEEGGLTVSGGEPMFQAEGCLQLLRLARRAGISTAVETCGQFEPALAEQLAGAADLLLWDLKDTDPARHKAYTGVSGVRILENLRRADEAGARIRLRCIMVQGVNMEDAHLRAIADICTSLHGCEGVELLAYHAYGSSKLKQLGRSGGGRKDWIPSTEQMRAAGARLRELGCRVVGL